MNMHVLVACCLLPGEAVTGLQYTAIHADTRTEVIINNMFWLYYALLGAQYSTSVLPRGFDGRDNMQIVWGGVT